LNLKSCILPVVFTTNTQINMGFHLAASQA